METKFKNIMKIKQIKDELIDLGFYQMAYQIEDKQKAIEDSDDNGDYMRRITYLHELSNELMTAIKVYQRATKMHQATYDPCYKIEAKHYDSVIDRIFNEIKGI